MQVVQQRIGELNGQGVYSFTMKNDCGMEVVCMNYGCIVTTIRVPDNNGIFENVVLGYDTFEEYVTNPNYLGTIVGRVGGRIKGARFEVDGKTYKLVENAGIHHIHGGIKGLNRAIWTAEIIEGEDEASIQFTYLSRDGEEGYPGNVSMTVTYTLNQENEWRITYDAVTDQKTPLTLTNHSYFNLSGNLKRDILHHSLKLKSKAYLELDESFIPTGKIVDVKDSPFDLTTGRTIESGATSNHPQNVLVGEGYDHPFLLSSNHDEEIVLIDVKSGRMLIVETDEVGVVVYSGNSLGDGGENRGIPLRKYLGICLETQGLPNAMNQSEFPSVLLDKDEKYHSVTKYKFGVIS